MLFLALFCQECTWKINKNQLEDDLYGFLFVNLKKLFFGESFKLVKIRLSSDLFRTILHTFNCILNLAFLYKSISNNTNKQFKGQVINYLKKLSNHEVDNILR